jgi:hypothetical protein
MLIGHVEIPFVRAKPVLLHLFMNCAALKARFENSR